MGSSIKNITTETTEGTENTVPTIGYFDIAEHHIDTAIELYTKGDYFCSATLAISAYTLTGDMLKHQGGESFHDELKKLIVAHGFSKDEAQNFADGIREIPNAYKHYKENTCEIAHNVKNIAENIIYSAIANYTKITKGGATELMVQFEREYKSNSASVNSVSSVVK